MIISPIYWKVNEVSLRYGFADKIYYSLPNGSIRQLLSAIYNNQLDKQKIDLTLTCFGLNFQGIMRKTLRLCDAILPNAYAEVRKIKTDFNLNELEKFFVIPNGVDIHNNSDSPNKFADYYGIKKDFVLCVGRIENRKNQLSLIKALKGTGVKLFLIGGYATEGERNYYDLCRKEADENVVFVNWVDAKTVYSAYQAAKVHVLPSWYETPGLGKFGSWFSGVQYCCNR